MQAGIRQMRSRGGAAEEQQVRGRRRSRSASTAALVSSSLPGRRVAGLLLLSGIRRGKLCLLLLEMASNAFFYGYCAGYANGLLPLQNALYCWTQSHLANAVGAHPLQLLGLCCPLISRRWCPSTACCHRLLHPRRPMHLVLNRPAPLLHWLAPPPPLPTTTLLLPDDRRRLLLNRMRPLLLHRCD